MHIKINCTTMQSLHIKHKKRVKKEQGDKESPAVKERKKEARYKNIYCQNSILFVKLY